MTKAHVEWDQWEEGMLLTEASFNLLQQVKALPHWEKEMILDALQEHLAESV